MTLPLAAGAVSWCADAMVAAAVLGGAALGARAGLFRSIVTGLAVFAAAFFSLAVTEWLARPLISLEVPPRLAIAAAFLTLFAAALAGMQRAATGLIEDKTMRLSRAADLVGGGCLGGCTGTLVAGSTLVAWSMLPLPLPQRIAPVGMTLDAGAFIIQGVGRCLAESREARETLLEGEPLARSRPVVTRRGQLPTGVAAGEPAPGIVWSSETFSDTNGNGLHDEGEHYIDADGNQAFSRRLRFLDADGDGVRDIGLLERYRLGRWDCAAVISDAGAESGPADGDAG